MTRCVGAFRRVCFILTDRQLCDACYAEVVRAFNPTGHRGGRPLVVYRATAKAMRLTAPPTSRPVDPIDWGRRLTTVPFQGDVDSGPCPPPSP